MKTWKKIEENVKIKQKSENLCNKIQFIGFLLLLYFGSNFQNFHNCGKSGHTTAKSQGYGAIKTWEKKIFYDLLWPNEISDLNNFNTEDFPRLFYGQSASKKICAESIFKKCNHKNVPLFFGKL